MPSAVIPGFQYRNAPAAIDWLCQVFGFERHAVYPGPDNTIKHAELTLGGGMIMLGPTRPDSPPLCPTCSAYLVVPDADVVHERARAAGAEIVAPIEDKPYGGRGFACRDLEGRLWHVGTYDPWAPK